MVNFNLPNSLTNNTYNDKISLTLNEIKRRNNVEALNMKKILKKVIALASAVAMTLSMSSFVSAAEDIVLEDSGSPFIKTFDPGDKGDYIYLGYAYCFEAGPEYKYLKITYTGEKTAFDELRLEFVINSDPAEEIKLTPKWFRENDEGTLVTTDGKEVPAPSDKEQTAIIDLEKSGVDLKTGIRAFHIHDTPGKGSFKIIDARLMTSPEGEAGSGDSNGEETKKEDENKNVEIVTDNAKNTSTGTVGSVKPGASGIPVWPIAAGVGGVVVVAVAFGITKSKKK